MKKPLLLFALITLTITATAQTPYEIFGHKGKTLETKLEKGGGIIIKSFVIIVSYYPLFSLF